MPTNRDPLGEFAALTENADLSAEITSLRDKLRKSQTRERESSRSNAALKEELGALRSALKLIEATEEREAPEWLSPELARGGQHATPVVCFSDFHFGEVVEPSEMNWYNAYNHEIAAQRIERFFERTIMLARDYLSGVTYDGIVVASLGDTISGDIHDEYRETNELSNFEAVPEVVPLIEAGLGLLVEEFGRVHYVGVPGNHPRDSRKPRYKKRSAHNADTMISKLVARRFKDDDRITFDVPDAFSADFRVYNTRFRAEHGDEATGGSGIQGALLPLALRTQRVRKQAQSEGHPFDVLLMGHWHQLMSLVSKGFVVNGAGKGYDEYARAKGYDPEPPQQALMVVTPEHGVGITAPVFVARRESEGW